MNTPSLILLRSDEPNHLALERLLSAAFDVRAVVVESGEAQRRALVRRGRHRASLWRTYHLWRRMLTGSTRYRRRFFMRVGDGVPAPGRTLHTDSVNNPEVEALLKSCAHDWIIVIGTSIIQPRILDASPKRFINIHGGCLPQYRGNHCVFHAYLDGRLDCLATTLHFVDRGVDTGEIISVCRKDETDVPLFAGPEYFYCASELIAFQKLIGFLKNATQSPVQGTPQSAEEGRTFKTSDRKPHHELLFLFTQLRRVWSRLIGRKRATTTLSRGGVHPTDRGSPPGSLGGAESE